MGMISVILAVTGMIYIVWCFMFWSLIGIWSVGATGPRSAYLQSFNEIVKQAKDRLGFFVFSGWCLVLFLWAPIAVPFGIGMSK